MNRNNNDHDAIVIIKDPPGENYHQTCTNLPGISRELTQRRRQRQRKRHLKISIWEMLNIFGLFLLPRILYC